MRRTFVSLRSLAAVAALLGLASTALIGAYPAQAASASPSSTSVDCNSLSASDDTTFSGPIGSTFTVTNTANAARCTVVGLSGATVTGLSQGAGPGELAAGATATFTITGSGGFDLSGAGSSMFTINATGSASTPSLNLVYATGYLNANGGTCTGAMQFTASPGAIASFTTPTRVECSNAEYVLAGWAYDPVSKTPDFDPGVTVPIGPSSFTLYAVWIPEGVEITYDANVAPETACLKDGVDQTTAESRQAGPYVVPLTSTVASQAPCAPDGFTLKGWALTGNGPAVLAPGEQLSYARRAQLDKMRVIAPVDEPGTACCPVTRTSGKVRVIAPVDSDACAKSGPLHHNRLIAPVDSPSDCSDVAFGEDVTLYAVWGRDITVDCPDTRGIPLWTFSCTDFGDVPIGATATLSVRITNQSLKAHNLELKPGTTLTTPNGELDLVDNSCDSVAAKQSCTIKIAWTPTTVGELGTVPLTVCQTGNALQCYQPSVAQQLRGNAVPADYLVTYDLRLTTPVPSILLGSSTPVAVEALRNGELMPNARVSLTASSGLAFPNGTMSTSVTTDATGAATVQVTGNAMTRGSVTAAYGNTSTTTPLRVTDVTVSIDKSSMNSGEQAIATITAAPRTRIKISTFDKLGVKNANATCGAPNSIAFWGLISGLVRKALIVVTDDTGKATVPVCGLLAPTTRGEDASSIAEAMAVGPGTLRAVVALPGDCTFNGCDWIPSNTDAASSDEVDVRTNVSMVVNTQEIAAVSSAPSPGTFNPGKVNGVTFTITSPTPNDSRIYVSTTPRPSRFWIANRIEASVIKDRAPIFYYTTSSYTGDITDAQERSHMYLTSGMPLHLYYLVGRMNENYNMTVDLAVRDVTSIYPNAYIIFPKAAEISAPAGVTAGQAFVPTVACNSRMGIICTS